MIEKIRSLIKRVVLTKSEPDTKNFPVYQISYKGKVIDAESIYAYGTHGVAPVGSLALSFNVDAHEDNQAVIAYKPDVRPMDLEPTEFACGNFVIGSIMIWKKTGDLVEITKGEKTITVDQDFNLTVGGAINITATGNTTVTSPQVDVIADLTNLGAGGQPIARLGDQVQVTVTGGSSAGTYTGTITGSGVNTSI